MDKILSVDQTLESQHHKDPYTPPPVDRVTHSHSKLRVLSRLRQVAQWSSHCHTDWLWVNGTRQTESWQWLQMLT